MGMLSKRSQGHDYHGHCGRAGVASSAVKALRVSTEGGGGGGGGGCCCWSGLTSDSHKWYREGGGRSSDSRFHDPRFERRQEHKKNLSQN